MDKHNEMITHTCTRPSIQQTGDHNLALTNLSGGNVNIIQPTSIEYDEKGIPFTPVQPVRFDLESGIVYNGNEKIHLPKPLIKSDILEIEGLPYEKALTDVYSEQLCRNIGNITPETLSKLPKNIQRHYSSQRNSYYRADYIQHVARESFADGPYQLAVLKEDAYSGIEETYFDENYNTGYDRLNAVLKRVTEISLTKSSLMNLRGFIGNAERKGLCHVLVNDKKIKSWVNIDE